MKVRDLKIAILKDLGCENKAKVRVYFKGDELQDEKPTMKQLSIDESNANFEIELYYTLKVEVYGKGKQYQAEADVLPSDYLETLRNKITFFKLFA